MGAATRNVLSCDHASADILGLGIRIGQYLQYAALLVVVLRGRFAALRLHGAVAAATALALLAAMAAGIHLHALTDAEVVSATGLFIIQLALMMLGLPIRRCASGVLGLEEAQRGVLRPRAALQRFRVSLGYDGKREATAPRWTSDWHRLAYGEAAARLAAACRAELATLAILLVIALQAATCVWFWDAGYSALQRPAHLQCGLPRAAPLFISIQADARWFRVLALVVSCCVLAVALWQLLLRMMVGLLPGNEASGNLLVELGLPPFASVKPGEARYSFTQSVTVELEARLTELRPVAVSRWVAAGIACLWILGLLLAVPLVEMSMRENGLSVPTSVQQIGQILSVLIGTAMLIHAFTAKVKSTL